MLLSERYVRNAPAISSAAMEKLLKARVCIVGLGGLGGFVANALIRAGVVNLTLVDKDMFDNSNLNRQLFATEKTVNKFKTEACLEQLKQINSSANIKLFTTEVTESNCQHIVSQQDVVVDCVDDVNYKLLLESACEKENVALVHGAISGFFGQASTVFPGDKTLSKIYSQRNNMKPIFLGSPVVTPMFIASVQSSETVKILTKQGELLKKKLLFADLLRNEFDVLKID